MVGLASLSLLDPPYRLALLDPPYRLQSDVKVAIEAVVASNFSPVAYNKKLVHPASRPQPKKAAGVPAQARVTSHLHPPSRSQIRRMTTASPAHFFCRMFLRPMVVLSAVSLTPFVSASAEEAEKSGSPSRHVRPGNPS